MPDGTEGNTQNTQNTQTPAGQAATPAAGQTATPPTGQTPATPVTPATPSTRKFKYNGQEVDLTEDQVEELLRIGADTFTKQEKEALKNQKPDEDEEPETETQKLKKEIDELRENYKKLSSTQARKQIEDELNEAMGVEFVKENPEIKDVIKDLTLVEAQRNPRVKLSQHVTNAVAKLENWSKARVAKAIEKKVVNNNRTRGTTGTAGAPAMQGAGKLTGDDLFNGKIRRAAEAATME